MMHSMGFPPQAFQAHAALALQLIALVSGVLLINKAFGADFFCKKTGKIIGGIVVLVSILSVICIGFLSIKRCCRNERGMMPSMPSHWQHPPMGTSEEMPLPPDAGTMPMKPKSGK